MIHKYGSKIDITIKGTKPLIQYSENRLIVYRRGFLAIYNLYDKKFEKKVGIPLSVLQKIICKIRILNRIFRVEPRAIEIISDNIFIFAIKGAVYRVDFNHNSMMLEHRFISGMNSPLSFCKIENIRGVKDGIYYGEYTSNLEKKPVSVFRRGLSEEDCWEKVYEFPEKTIHHIHCIQVDKKKEKVYILTGDDDLASGFWIVKENFSMVIPVLYGKQIYRACFLAFVNDEIVYITDSPMKQNYICRCREENDKWIFIDKQRIAGPCIYGDYNDTDLLISTTVEPNTCLNGDSTLSHLFKRKRGDGIWNNYVHVIVGNFECGFNEYERIEKDSLPMGLFQFGSVQFPKYSFRHYNRINLYYTAIKRKDNVWKILDYFSI